MHGLVDDPNILGAFKWVMDVIRGDEDSPSPLERDINLELIEIQAEERRRKRRVRPPATPKPHGFAWVPSYEAALKGAQDREDAMRQQLLDLGREDF